MSGGISDPRNSTLLRMFSFIDIGERAGSGIPNIFHAWAMQGLDTPYIEEKSSPDRTTLVLPLTMQNTTSSKKPTIKTDDKNRR